MTNAEILHVRTTLETRGPAAAILLDDAQVARVGGGAKAFPVAVTIAGQTVALRLARMRGENLIGLRREVREQLGVEAGDVLDVIIARDDAERTIELPAELDRALATDPATRAAFDALAPSHRREHARAVADAKKLETRARRVERVLEALRS